MYVYKIPRNAHNSYTPHNVIDKLIAFITAIALRKYFRPATRCILYCIYYADRCVLSTLSLFLCISRISRVARWTTNPRSARHPEKVVKSISYRTGRWGGKIHYKHCTANPAKRPRRRSTIGHVLRELKPSHIERTEPWMNTQADQRKPFTDQQRWDFNKVSAKAPAGLRFLLRVWVWIPERKDVRRGRRYRTKRKCSDVVRLNIE